ncbi:YqaJ viral recombinase family protein [Thiorhodococcus minor]|uniref:Endonuclease n=1 Tax=Thiorhodococcus minor TaxID=57489 RepID=A0A6M0K2Y3_9GAMM|nr:YqaJ viral recombinase family protein [Thiorhodococcus minor]NEV64136.1 endonuclease [Thiorhodococcus minor]
MLTEAHAEARRRGIGGSDVAAIAGLSPWRSALDVYYDKTEGSPQEENDAMHWGSILEEPVAAEYARVTGHKIRRVNSVLEHPEHPFMLASLDRRIVAHPDGPGVLEIKTTLRRTDDWGEPGTDAVPDYYALQVHQYLTITGHTWADLAVLFLAERRFEIYRLGADPEISAWLIALERRFWTEHVEPRIPPEPQSLSDLARRYPKDSGGRIVADGELLAAHANLQQVREEIKGLESRKDALEVQLKQAMAEASELVGADGKPIATWKTQARKRLDTKALRAAHPEIVQQFTTQAESRVFRLK